MNASETDLLIVGAGPFGLALAAYAQHLGIGHTVVGTSMGFWKGNMPKNMLLRSTCGWHLDPMDIHTIDAYLETLGKACADVEPLSLAFYLDYAAWFQKQKQVRSLDASVERLEKQGDGMTATFSDDRRIEARNVVLALGFRNFENSPVEMRDLIPREHCHHTCELVDLERFRGKRVLIVGGRQSAFEWAALSREEGAAEVHISYRHATPAFTPSDWSWVEPMVTSMESDPSWFRRLSKDEREALVARFWAEGRLKLEPWLAPRIEAENVHLHPQTRVAYCEGEVDGLKVKLDSGAVLSIDEVVFATGYRMDLNRVPFLEPGLRGGIETRNGFPTLDEHFQTSVPGLYMTSMAATQDFGPFFGFTVSVRSSARIIAGHIRAQL